MTYLTFLLLRVRLGVADVLRTKTSEWVLSLVDVFPLDMVPELRVSEAHLTTDPALAPQLVRPAPHHLLPVGPQGVLQEGLLGETDEQHSLAGTEHAAEDLERIRLFRDSDQFVKVLDIILQNSVLSGDVFDYVLERLEASLPLLTRLTDIAVEEFVCVDLSSEERTVDQVWIE